MGSTQHPGKSQDNSLIEVARRAILEGAHLRQQSSELRAAHRETRQRLVDNIRKLGGGRPW